MFTTLFPCLFFFCSDKYRACTAVQFFPTNSHLFFTPTIFSIIFPIPGDFKQKVQEHWLCLQDETNWKLSWKRSKSGQAGQMVTLIDSSWRVICKQEQGTSCSILPITSSTTATHPKKVIVYICAAQYFGRVKWESQNLLPYFSVKSFLTNFPLVSVLIRQNSEKDFHRFFFTWKSSLKSSQTN